MTHFETLPAWAAIAVAFLVVFGAGLTLIGAIGLWRLPSFYDRLHAPTLGTSWGTAGIVLASILMFSVAGGRAVIHESVIAIFIMVTTPVTLMLLGRAALHRDRVEGNVPFQFAREDEHEAKAAQQLAQAEARANIISAQEASLAAEQAVSPEVLPTDHPPQDGPVEPGAAVADLQDGDAEAAALPGSDAEADTSEQGLPQSISPDSLSVTPSSAAPVATGGLFPKPADPSAAQGPHKAELSEDPPTDQQAEATDAPVSETSDKPVLPEY